MKRLYKNINNGKLFNVLNKNVINYKNNEKMILMQTIDLDCFCFLTNNFEKFENTFKYVCHYEPESLLNFANETLFYKKIRKFNDDNLIKKDNIYTYATFTNLKCIDYNTENEYAPYVLYQEFDKIFAKEIYY